MDNSDALRWDFGESLKTAASEEDRFPKRAVEIHLKRQTVTDQALL